MAGLLASLGVATLWIIAFNSGCPEGGSNKDSLYCCLQECVYVRVCVHSALHSIHSANFPSVLCFFSPFFCC